MSEPETTFEDTVDGNTLLGVLAQLQAGQRVLGVDARSGDSKHDLDPSAAARAG